MICHRGARTDTFKILPVDYYFVNEYSTEYGRSENNRKTFMGA